MYDRSNIFAKIIRKEAPCKKIYENEYALSFKDIFPKASTHIIVIPKGYYKDLTDFLNNATLEEKEYFFNAINETIKILKLEDGYRVISNSGIKGGQEVPHLHFHILADENLGPTVSKK